MPLDVVAASHPDSSQSGPPDEAPWQSSLRNAVRTVDALCTLLGLDRDELGPALADDYGFPLFVPLEFVSRMERGNPQDPLLLQVLPRSQESETALGFVRDPVGDQFAEVMPGLLHKYEGRVLLIASGVCAIHCRYCFRRHFPYESAPKSIGQWDQALEYIANDPSIHEVILSGGDPLMLVDARLSQLTERLDGISHLKRLRLHTRVPVVIPSRINAEFCRWLGNSRLAKWVVLHINHRNEIDSSLERAIGRLRGTGATVLNQSVLLRNVNDNIESMRGLCQALIDLGVVPYYLHQLDRVDGAAHFDVPAEVGLSLIDAMQRTLPGLGVPRYVREIAGAESKRVVQ